MDHFFNRFPVRYEKFSSKKAERVKKFDPELSDAAAPAGAGTG